VIATGIDQKQKEMQLGSTSSRTETSQQRGGMFSSTSEQKPASEAVNMAQSQAPANSNDPFGNWDIRREPSSSRPVNNNNNGSEFKNVEKADFDVFNDNGQTDDTNNNDDNGDSLDTPPFFKRRRK